MADPSPLQNAIQEARETAREQLSAAWQIEVDRIQEQMAAGWRGHLERVFEERFGELSASLEQHFQSAVTAESTRLRRQLSSQLNQAIRRFRDFESEEAWSKAFIDSTAGLCDRSALFIVGGVSLRLQASRGFASEAKIDNTPLASAPAFAHAVETRDTIVALRTKGELSDPIAEWAGEQPDQRFYLFPVTARSRIAAILYADSGTNGEIDASALELLAMVASLVLENQTVAPAPSGASHLVSIATGKPAEPSISSWFSLNKEDQELHLKAQRFARVQAAELRLYKSHAVKEGRLSRNLYTALQSEIDAAREAFRRDFLSASNTMVDYLHVELLRTLANDDVELLGPDYPGPLA